MTTAQHSIMYYSSMRIVIKYFVAFITCYYHKFYLVPIIYKYFHDIETPSIITTSKIIST